MGEFRDQGWRWLGLGIFNVCVYIYIYIELLVVSANPSFHHNFTFQLGSSTIIPSKTTRNLGVVID